jgi:hypothetical protein
MKRIQNPNGCILAPMGAKRGQWVHFVKNGFNFNEWVQMYSL